MSRTAARETTPERVPPQVPLGPAPRLRRRPFLAVTAVAGIMLGAGAGFVAYTSLSDTQSALVTTRTVHAGEIIDASALTRVNVDSDPALDTVPGSALDDVVGQRAALDIGAGAVLTPDAVADAPFPADGMSVIGVVLPAPAAPSVPLDPGDRVRVVVTAAGETGVDAPDPSPEFYEAEVVAVTTAAAGETVVNVLLPESEALTLGADLAAGTPTVILDSAGG
jgi:hypothetical protein